jgi:hypothetical protein
VQRHCSQGCRQRGLNHRRHIRLMRTRPGGRVLLGRSPPRAWRKGGRFRGDGRSTRVLGQVAAHPFRPAVEYTSSRAGPGRRRSSARAPQQQHTTPVHPEGKTPHHERMGSRMQSTGMCCVQRRLFAASSACTHAVSRVHTPPAQWDS